MGSFYERIAESTTMILSPGGGVDPDDAKWRSATSNAIKEDLTSASRAKTIKIARYLWLTNPIAHRLVEMLVAFTVGGESASLLRILQSKKSSPSSGMIQ